MKVNRLEAHDRLLFLKKDQGSNIAQGAQDCLKKNELSLALQDKSPYIYIFAHPRTADDGINKRMLWQPRLTKPAAQTNSYLFRAISKTDILQICWLLPPREQWKQYQKGNVTEHEWVLWSIRQFQTNRQELEKCESDDVTQEQFEKIMMQVIAEHNQKIMMDRLWIHQES